MNLANIVVVQKASTYEFDMHRHRLTHDELIAKYQREGTDPQKIIESHERHYQSIANLKKIFSESQFVPRDRFTREIAAKADLVIALGGDDHFQYAAHFVDDTLMMGVNFDPSTSEGALN